MMKELAEGMKVRLRERISNPLLATFTLSWIIVNYEVFVILLSNLPAESKILRINDGLFGGWRCILDGILKPLTYALFYIYAMPIPIRAVYKHYAMRQLELREDRLRIENLTMLTQEESMAIRAENYQLRTNYDNLKKESEAKILLLTQEKETLERQQFAVQRNLKPITLPDVETVSDQVDLNRELILHIMNDVYNEPKIVREEYANHFDNKDRLAVDVKIDKLIAEGIIDRTSTPEGTVLSLSAKGRAALFRLKSTGDQ